MFRIFNKNKRLLTEDCHHGHLILISKEEKMKPKSIDFFEGQHCETTATGTLLKQSGVELSEPMLFGLGEGLGFIFWNMKSMDFPFFGGRIKVDLLTKNLAKNLSLNLQVKETGSKQKAWQEVKGLLDSGKAVGLKLDCYYLEYFSNPFHFAGHYATIYDYDAHSAYLIDTQQQGTKVRTSLESLALARAAKGPMSSKNLYYTIEQGNNDFDIKFAIRNAILANATDYLNPTITNIAFKGILKASAGIQTWFQKSENIASEFKAAANIMENAGTGGALFRNLYSDFLKEAFSILEIPVILEAHQAFEIISTLWTKVAELFIRISETKDKKYLDEASIILKQIAEMEKSAMTLLAGV